ncbi:YebO family protein [Dickeya chrysanthemi]|uniref:YebO family protein n=1 Tax=Dickeya chrysanthemi TaxID=556 RepID=A0ABU8JR17_DICCH|nr:YebO family protein [Dickeya chrysanthemi]MBX9447533.1 YebO family protein [Dickeya chrysanthemi]MCA7008817.1 YebO family protein [Dickeya chrysanthemi]
MSSFASDMLEVVFVALIVLLVILVWFFINRASVRANEQIRLLHEIVEQQKQQIALLQSLVPMTVQDAEPLPEQPATLPETKENEVEALFKDMIPER